MGLVDEEQQEFRCAASPTIAVAEEQFGGAIWRAIWGQRRVDFYDNTNRRPASADFCE